METDRRQEIRIPLELPLECQGIGNKTDYAPKHEMACQDLSRGGMSLTSEKPFDVGETLVFSFSLPQGQKQESIAGAVRWCGGPPESRKIGIQFTKPLDFSVPISVTAKAVGSLQQYNPFDVEQLYEASGDAFVWIDSDGRIVRPDQRFLHLLGFSRAEIVGQSLAGFVHPNDHTDLANMLNPPQPGQASSAAGTFRIKAKDNRSLLWKMLFLPKSTGETLQGIYVEDKTATYESKSHRHQLEQMTRALEDDFPGQVILLNSDLTIARFGGAHTTVKKGKRKARPLRGKDLRKATGLVDIKVNGQRLLDVLEYCAQTGRESEIKGCRYQGRPGNTSDLFTPGTFCTKITPIQDPGGEITTLLMRVRPEDPLGIHDSQGDKGRKNQNRLGKILGAAAKGYLLNDVLTEFSTPLTHLLTELDLFTSKWERLTPILSQTGGDKTPLNTLGIKQVRKNVGHICDKLYEVLKNMSPTSPQEGNPGQVNRCLSKAIQTGQMAEGMAGIAITCERGSGLPQAQADGQELAMVFLVFLLLSKDCFSNLSRRSIHCKTAKNGNHLVVRFSHNGFIQKDRYLKILFHHDPLEDYFLKCASLSQTDTLLYYANFLLKKNAIRMKLTNIPGHFNLSLIIPATAL
jgi:PAS domain S-box-containing protein